MGSDQNYVAELFDLTDRVVLITGGSRGLGREMAFAAAHCGADVIIASRKYDACVATAEEITAATGRAALPYAVHVGRWDQLDGLVDAAQASYLRLAMTTSAPQCAAANAISRPSPRLPPVTNTTRSVRSNSSAT